MRRRKPKNDIFFEKLEIIDIADEGKGVAKHEELVVFIEGTVPQDIVDVKVTFKKKNYCEAVVTHFHKKSPFRTEAFCEHFGICGGCKWQNMGYEQQLFFKQKHVTDCLTRIAKVELPTPEPILASSLTEFYRNKLEFTFSNKRWFTNDEIKLEDRGSFNALGFHIPKRFDKILNINKCYLQTDPSNEIRNAVKQFAEETNFSFFDLKIQTGLLRNLIIRIASTGEIMVIVQFFENDEEKRELLMNYIKNTFPQITSLLYIINQKGNETFQDQEIITFSGKDYIEEEMEGLRFRIGPKSFYQTNSQQAYELYKVARDFAQLSGNELVYDLYTGTGTIANFVARQARKVVGVEYVPSAIEDAKINSQINGIHNTVFYAGDMKNVLNEQFIVENGQPDVVITDPPRAGMDAGVVETLLKMNPQKIVYVSCNPSTQARDLALMNAQYKVTKTKAVDMFPHTHHIESVVLLKRR